MLTTSPGRSWTGLALLILLGGCASVPDHLAEYALPSQRIELDDVPFYPQERFQCGPAALTTILAASGSDVMLESVVRQAYLPGRQGSLQLELVATARSSGRIPYIIDGSLASIQRELLAGRPVLVLQNLGVSWYPRWHYAVVVGVEPMSGAVILRSGTDRRRLTRTATFMRTWQRSDYWAMVALRPGELPAEVESDRYFNAVSAMESIGDHEAALAGWNAALSRWPNARIALFGKGNSLLNLGMHAEAIGTYRLLLDIDPNMFGARHNLAHALYRQGDCAAAISELDYILERVGEGDRFYSAYESSLNEFTGAGNVAEYCGSPVPASEKYD